MKFTDFAMFSHHPEVSGLIEWWNSHLKTSLQCQLGGNTLQGRGKVLQKAVYALNQCQTYDSVSFTARIHRSRNQGDGNECGTIHYLP